MASQYIENQSPNKTLSEFEESDLRLEDTAFNESPVYAIIHVSAIICPLLLALFCIFGKIEFHAAIFLISGFLIIAGLFILLKSAFDIENFEKILHDDNNHSRSFKDFLDSKKKPFKDFLDSKKSKKTLYFIGMTLGFYISNYLSQSLTHRIGSVVFENFMFVTLVLTGFFIFYTCLKNFFRHAINAGIVTCLILALLMQLFFEKAISSDQGNFINYLRMIIVLSVPVVSALLLYRQKHHPIEE